MLLILLPLVTTPYVSRVLGAENLGMYTYTYTAANYFVLFAMLGVKNYGNRSVASVRENKTDMSRTFWEIWGLQALCAVIALCGYAVFVVCFGRENKILFLWQSLFVLSSLFDISWLFSGLEKFSITVTRSIVIKLLSLFAIFLFVKTADDLWKYTLIMALSILLSQLTLWRYLPRYVERCKVGIRGILRHFCAELSLFVPVIAVSLYKMMDKLMLKEMSTYVQVGFYESADRIIGIPLGVITALGTVMLPRMSHLASKSDTDKSMRYIRTSILFAMFMACGMMFGLAAIADDFIPLFLGAAYAPAAVLLQWMAPTVLFIAWANVIRTQYLIPNHKDKSYIVSVLCGAVFNIVCNFLLIPRYQAMGAVIATLGAEALVCMVQTVAVRRQLPVFRYFKETVPLLLPGAVMLCVVRAVRVPFLRWDAVSRLGAVVLEVVIGGAVYVLLAGAWILVLRRKAKRQHG